MAQEIHSKLFTGKWASEHGQRLSIRNVPLLGFVATYWPRRKRPHLLLAFEQGNTLAVSLGFFGPFGTMLLLSPASEAATRKDLLVPALECGPESSWEQEGFGFPWTVPLAAFRRIEP